MKARFKAIKLNYIRKQETKRKCYELKYQICCGRGMDVFWNIRDDQEVNCIDQESEIKFNHCKLSDIRCAFGMDNDILLFIIVRGMLFNIQCS